MKIIYKENNWKPVTIEGSVASGDLSKLVGIEELDDYEITSTKNKPGDKRKNIKPHLQTKKLKIETNVKKTIIKEKSQISNSKQHKIKKKKEIGEFIENNDCNEENCKLEDLCAWSLVPLPNEILQGLADLKFTKPTHIQELTLPPAIYGRRDILGAAETGSGKTLAFGIPIISGILKLKQKEKEQEEKNDFETDPDEISDEDNIESENIESDFEENSDDQENIESDEEHEDNLDSNEFGCVKVIDNIELEKPKISKPFKKLYALILTPTRELAIQIKNHLIAVAKYTDIKVAVILGGMAIVKQERILNKGPEIVVATPGRLWELIQEGNPHLSQVDDIRYLAIDETDRMLEKSHFQELHQLLERINNDEQKRKKRQNFVFSATLTMVHNLPRYLLNIKKRKSNKVHKLTPAEKLQNIIDVLGINNPKIVDVTEKSGTAKSLTECKINCPLEEKDYYVYYFLQKHPGRTLIFCNSIDCVKRLSNLLSVLGCTSLPLHANMQQRQRLKNLERFRDDPLGILVATDVAARGLDIPSVEHVLHYQTPRTSESYVHRSGRTARASKEGITVLLIEPKEVQNYLKLCTSLNRTKDLPSFPIMENYLTAVKKRVNLARKLEKLELQQKRTKSNTGWLQKAAKDMDIILDDDEFHLENDSEEIAKKKRQINFVRKELQQLLSKPIFPKGFSIKYPTFSAQNMPLIQGEQKPEKAVDVMKAHLQNYSKIQNYECKRVYNKQQSIKERMKLKQKLKDSKKKLKKKNSTNLNKKN